MAALYADENFRYPVVTALRLPGHDVLTCQEAGRADQGIDDSTVLADALGMQRILLTQNRNNFKRLHKQGLLHHGIVVCTYDADTQALALRIAEAVAREEPGGRWLASVVRPNPGRSAARKKPRREGRSATLGNPTDLTQSLTAIRSVPLVCPGE